MPEELGPEADETGTETSDAETRIEPEPQPRIISDEDWQELWGKTNGARPEGLGVKQSRKILLDGTWYKFFGGSIIKGEESVSIEVPGERGEVTHEKLSANDPRIRMIIDDYGYYTYLNLSQNPDLKPKRMF